MGQDDVTIIDKPGRGRPGYADQKAQTVLDDGRLPARAYRPTQIGPRIQPKTLDVDFAYHDAVVVVGSGRAILNLPYPGFSFPIDERGITIGRSEKADLQMIDGTVSGMHARLRYQSGVLSIEDLGSTNGTYLNGREIEPYTPTRVRDGSQIKFAKRLENTILLHFRR